MHSNSSYTDIRNLIKEKVKVPRLEKKEEILAEYFANQKPDSKKFLCRFFLKGKCLFDQKQCHFSHGLDDLIFEKPGLEMNLQRIKDHAKQEKIREEFEDPSMGVEELHDRQSKEQKSREQPSLNLEDTYRTLFEFQSRMIQMNESKQLHSQEEIDKDPKLRGMIKDIFQRDLQQKLLYFFFNQYNMRFLPKEFIDLCFSKIGWFTISKKIINTYCCYEVDHPEYGPVVLRFPRIYDFEDLIEGCIVKIFKEHNLITQVPVKSSLISNLYENSLMAQDIFLPKITSFASRKKARLDDVLQEFQIKESFLQKLSVELNLSIEDLQSKKLFEHEKGENIKSRDEVIASYKSKQIIDGKSQLCRFFMRGLCIFDNQTCKFAHGIGDLVWKELRIEDYENGDLDQKVNQEYKIWQNNWKDILKESQPSLNLEFVYKGLYEYQQNMINNQELISQEEFNTNDAARKKIHTELTKQLINQQFINFLFKTYKRQYLKKSFVDKCCQSIGWVTNWNKILDGEFCYEVQLLKIGSVIVRFPPSEELDTLMEDSIIKIIKKNSLLENLPISAATISKYFYKDLISVDPLLPTLQIFLKGKGLDIDDYLQSLQDQPIFKSKILKECNKSEEELSKLVLFDSSKTELNNLMVKMKKILIELLEKSAIGFILFRRFEESVSKKCSKEIARFYGNNMFIKKIIRGVAINSGVFIINLISETYLFSLKKFKNVDCEKLSEKNYLAKLDTKCKKKNSTSGHNFCKHSLLTEEFESPNGIKEESPENGIDMKKITVVDNEETLKEAMERLIQCQIIAIDLEGTLEKGGMVELIQVGSGDQIFIFDLYKIHQAEGHDLSKRMITEIRKMMENPSICKVFHDCRKDSLALHLFVDCCPVNVFDVSGMHTLIEHLEVYLNYKDLIFSEKNQNEDENVQASKLEFEKGLEILAHLDDLKAPGLNEILRSYGASHGINHLKAAMKKKFEEMPREYFLKRPLDKEYLIYSAKDVEDLVEVKNNIEARTTEILEKLTGTLQNKKLIEFLWKKVSKTYSLFGCSNYQN